MAKSKKSKPKKARVSLNPLREQLQVLVDQANARAKILIDSSMTSRALEEAQRTLKSQSKRVDDNELFRANLKTRREINREFARVSTFLSDYTSSLKGAQEFTSDLAGLRGAFGGQWKEVTGERFDTSRIDKEIAKQAFDTYRRIVESVGGWERAVGMFQGKEILVGYGSETLITNIYDMYINKEQGLITDRMVKDFDPELENAESFIYAKARQLAEEGIEAYERMSKQQVSGYDYGPLFEDEDAVSRRRFYTWKHKFKNSLKG